MKGCLTDAELKAILSGTTTDDQQAAVTDHLSSCARCQSELLAGAGSSEVLHEMLAPEDYDAAPHPPPIAELIRQLASAEPTSLTDGSEDSSWAEVREHLEPSDREGSLGRFGAYEVLQVVDSGGMGIVLKALDPQLNRIVALKVLTPLLAAKSQGRQRFVREARAVAAIHHDHVVAIYAVAEAKGLPFLAMEFVEGESLARRLQRAGPLTCAEIVSIGKQLAAGLAAAHAQGIIHRDIKPANVLIEQSTGNVKLTDFGLARAVDDTGLTRSGFIAGTPDYLSPEQAAGKPADTRSDLFSFGCLLYAACTGRSPFHADTTLAVLRRVADYSPQPVHRVNPQIPIWPSRVIEKLLRKNPSERFASANEVIEALENSGSGLERRIWKHWSPRPMRRRLVLAVIPLLSVALVLLLQRSGVPKPFCLRNEFGDVAGKFANLADALVHVPPHGAIELRWNGPRDMEPVRLPDKPLTLRAPDGFSPVWVHRSETGSAVRASAALTLEGIEFLHELGGTNQTRPPQAGPAPDHSAQIMIGHEEPGSGSLVHSDRANVMISHCKFEQRSVDGRLRLDLACITLENTVACILRNTALMAAPGKAIVWRYRPKRDSVEKSVMEAPPSQLSLSNCVVFATEGVWADLSAAARASLELVQSSFKGRTVLYLPSASSPSLAVDSQNTLFNTGCVIVDDRSQDAVPLEQSLKWADRESLFCLHRAFIGGPAAGTHSLDSLRDWELYWQQPPSNSRLGTARFAAFRERGSAAFGREIRLQDFQVTELHIDEGPPASQDQWHRFGANTAAIGPIQSQSPPIAGSESSSRR